MFRKMAVTLCALAVAGVLSAQSLDSKFMRDAVGTRAYPEAPRLAEQAAIAPAMELSESLKSVPEAVEAIYEWNAQNRFPAKIGFTRDLPQAIDVQLSQAAAKQGLTQFAHGALAASDRGLVWSGIVVVQSAYRVRLHLSHVNLPDDAVLWVYSPATAPVAFGKDLVDADGGLWTPSVRGGRVTIEVEAAPAKSGAAASFTIDKVLEIVAPREGSASAQSAPKHFATNDDASCLSDASCQDATVWPAIDNVRKAVGQMEYVNGGNAYVCSGGLLNNTLGNGTPYFLTANHCISSQSVATTLETHWDYRTPSCGGTIPDINAVPRSNGAQLLTTSAASDVTLLRLNSIPSGRILLGWNASTSVVPSGTSLFRISHPAPDGYPYPQSYSRKVVDTATKTCSNGSDGSIWTRPGNLYSVGGYAGTYGGSSGSPTILSNGQVVGQLHGGCGFNGVDPSDGCDQRLYTVDGAFSQSFSSLQQYLSPSSNPAQPTPCAPSATQVCLNNDRFTVAVSWKTSGGQTGQGQAIKYTADSALFWFFGASNIEMLVKLLDACSLNQRYWMFAAATTDVEYTLTVTDSKTGTVKSYFHAGGTPAPAITDTGAFATCQ